MSSLQPNSKNFQKIKKCHRTGLNLQYPEPWVEVIATMLSLLAAKILNYRGIYITLRIQDLDSISRILLK